MIVRNGVLTSLTLSEAVLALTGLSNKYKSVSAYRSALLAENAEWISSVSRARSEITVEYCGVSTNDYHIVKHDEVLYLEKLLSDEIKLAQEECFFSDEEPCHKQTCIELVNNRSYSWSLRYVEVTTKSLDLFCEKLFSKNAEGLEKTSKYYHSKVKSTN